MRTLPPTIFLFFIGLLATAQTSEEFQVDFDKDCFLKSNASSESFEVNIPRDAPFASLSAYILEPELDSKLSFRLKNEDDWSDWQELAKDEHGSTPDRTTFKAPPIEEDFSEIQFRSSDSLDKEVVFRLYFPASSEKKSPDQRLGAAADSSCSCAKPAICGRSCWCPSGNCDGSPSPTYTTPTHIIVHHSAGGNNVSDYAALVSAYWDFHVNTNGWEDIGYNWLIDPNGVVYEGRGDSVLGSHFSCMNSGTTGICLIGNFEDTIPTPEALKSLTDLAAWEACDKEIVPWASSWHESSELVLPHIAGHNDGNSSTAPNGCPKGTLCPGKNLSSVLFNIQEAVSSDTCIGYLHRKEEGFAATEFEVYPNPASDVLYIKSTEKIETAELIDPNGKVVKQTAADNVMVKGLPKGMYLLKISFKNAVRTEKVIIH